MSMTKTELRELRKEIADIRQERGCEWAKGCDSHDPRRLVLISKDGFGVAMHHLLGNQRGNREDILEIARERICLCRAHARQYRTAHGL